MNTTAYDSLNIVRRLQAEFELMAAGADMRKLMWLRLLAPTIVHEVVSPVKPRKSWAA